MGLATVLVSKMMVVLPGVDGIQEGSVAPGEMLGSFRGTIDPKKGAEEERERVSKKRQD